jgi:drug/metabolite transporter (DMT)-like permease
MPDTSSRTARAYLLLAVMPLFFASNLVIGRAAVGSVDPFTLAFFRWGLASALLLPFAWAGLREHAEALRARGPAILWLAFLGMWVCGAIVYVSLQHTTATNATLIYATSPIFVIAMQMLRGRAASPGELIGVALAVVGILVIVLRGDPAALLALSFNIGDIGILVCAYAWAVYSVVLKRDTFKGFPTLTLFTVVACVGAAMLFPFMVAESLWHQRFPLEGRQWLAMVGLAIVPSILAFSSYQYGVKVLGPALTSISLYLLPVYGVVLATLTLGETLAAHHLVGMALVIGGVVLATRPRGA